MLDIIMPIVNTGAVGCMLILVWRLMIKKDRKSYQMIEAQNAERREMYESHSELIKEVTEALVNKNHTDDKMSSAVVKLAEELREIRGVLKEKNNGTT
jgi:hypothetical protein